MFCSPPPSFSPSAATEALRHGRELVTNWRGGEEPSEEIEPASRPGLADWTSPAPLLHPVQVHPVLQQGNQSDSEDSAGERGRTDRAACSSVIAAATPLLAAPFLLILSSSSYLIFALVMVLLYIILSD
eukprot:752030-Hanusia_phi.AAC.2